MQLTMLKARAVVIAMGSLMAIASGVAIAHSDGEGPADPASATAPLVFDIAVALSGAGGRAALSWPDLFDRDGRFRSDAEIEAVSQRTANRDSAVTHPTVRPPDRAAARPPWPR